MAKRAGKLRRTVGRPFQKGEDPRRARGRPPLGESFAEMVRNSERGRLETALNKVWDKAERGDQRALEFLADRGWGRPATAVEVTGQDGGPIEITGARERLARLISRQADSRSAKEVA